MGLTLICFQFVDWFSTRLDEQQKTNIDRQNKRILRNLSHYSC